jgi:hypothetical protein
MSFKFWCELGKDVWMTLRRRHELLPWTAGTGRRTISVIGLACRWQVCVERANIVRPMLDRRKVDDLTNVKDYFAETESRVHRPEC